MAKLSFRRINDNSWINNTWLAPYSQRIVKLMEYKNGRIDLYLDGFIYKHVEGGYTSEYNGWQYTIKKLLGKPLKNLHI